MPTTCSATYHMLLALSAFSTLLAPPPPSTCLSVSPFIPRLFRQMTCLNVRLCRQTSAGSRSVLVPPFCLAESVRHPPRPHHLHHAGRVLVRVLLRLDRALPGRAHDRVSDIVVHLGVLMTVL